MTLAAYNRSWTTLALLNSWVAYDAGWTGQEGSGWPPLQYLKTPDGFVHLRGLIKNGTTTATTQVALLPSGCRPGSVGLFAVANNAQVSRVDVAPSGSLFIYTALDGAGSAVNNAWLSFFGVSFLAYP